MKCILCNIPLYHYLTKNGYEIYKCQSCHLAQTDLKKEYSSFVKDFYSRGYYEGDPTRSAYTDYGVDKPLIVKNMERFLSFIRDKKSSGKLLDVGCAYGFFVELALRRGFDAYGFDPSGYAVKKAKALVGAKRIRMGTIGDVSYANTSFDVITMFDVFEHLEDPLGDMKKLCRLLKPDGIIVIATGDTQSIAAKIMKRRWTFFIPPQHIFFFHRKNVTKLLALAGLKPIKWHRVGKWLSVGYILHLGRTTGESVLADWIYKIFHKTPLMNIPLYVPMKDNMVIEVTKV